MCVWAFEQEKRRFESQDVLTPWKIPTDTPESALQGDPRYNSKRIKEIEIASEVTLPSHES